MPSRAKKQSASTSSGRQAATLAGFNAGYNGYTNPIMMSWQEWFNASNVFSGQNSRVRRARFAQVVNIKTAQYVAQKVIFSSLFNFRDPTPQEILLGDINNKLWSFNVGNNYQALQRFNPYFDPAGIGNPVLIGPWSRASLFNTCFEMNGQVKQTGRGLNVSTIEGLGLDSPDTSPL